VISDFERRLADVLGTRLFPPFAGRVDVPPGALTGNGPIILAGVTRVRAGQPLVGSAKPEVVPGDTNPRRVLRLACEITIEVRVSTPVQGRTLLMQGLEQVMYVLDAADFRSGQALATGAPTDPGFLLQSLALVEGTAPLDPTADDALLIAVGARAEGWFWPVGATGEAGIAIGEIRLRGAALPLHVTPANPSLVAGGAPVDLTVRVGAGSFGTFALPDQPALPFGSLVFMVLDAGGRPGKGTLADAVGGVRLVPLTNNAATVRYQPPDEPASDQLVILLDDGAGGGGIEIARAALRVRAG
jgi:hypothetical protein